MKYSKRIVSICIIFIVLYTISQIVLNYMIGMEISPTLTTCVYAFFGTELAACAAIKIFEKEERQSKKRKKSSDNTQINDMDRRG